MKIEITNLEFLTKVENEKSKIYSLLIERISFINDFKYYMTLLHSE